MITSITVEDFKCFEALELPCAPLTVLTGYNAAGKSTALQTLLLLAQALRAATGGSARGAAGAARTGMRVCIVGSGPAGRGRLKKRGRHNRREGSGNDAPGRQIGVVGIHDSVYVVMPWCRES